MLSDSYVYILLLVIISKVGVIRKSGVSPATNMLSKKENYLRVFTSSRRELRRTNPTPHSCRGRETYAFAMPIAIGMSSFLIGMDGIPATVFSPVAGRFHQKHMDGYNTSSGRELRCKFPQTCNGVFTCCG